jgi:pimeloyl-ACP methyl ester carboxylesterase
MATASFLGEDATFLVTAHDGAVLPIYCWRGPARAPALLMAHANGFAAGSYAPWLGLLARDLAVFALDARGHGRSSWPEGALDEIFHVDRFADDLALVAAAVAERCGAGGLHFAGHSLGAAAALRLAARGPFARFGADFLAAHCRASLRPLPQGGFTLACPPAGGDRRRPCRARRSRYARSELGKRGATRDDGTHRRCAINDSGGNRSYDDLRGAPDLPGLVLDEIARHA